MNRTFVGTIGAIVVSVAVMAAQQKPETKAPQPKASKSSGEVTFTGCLEPGTKDGNFALTNAAQKGQKGRASYIVVGASPKVPLASNITREVEIQGTITSQGAAPAVKGDDAQELPTITATKVKWRSDYCG